MSLFQTIGMPSKSNFLIQILLAPAGLTGAWECAPADHDDRSGLAVVAVKVVHPGESGQAVGYDTHRHDRRIARMNIHKNARLTPPGRLLLVQRIEGGGWELAADRRCSHAQSRRDPCLIS